METEKISAEYQRSSSTIDALGTIKPFAESARTLVSMGHSPIPQHGQACRVQGWPRFAKQPLDPHELNRYAGSPIPYDIGIALGHANVVVVDRDTDDEDVRAALRPVFEIVYRRGGVPVAKFGSKGLTSFFRYDGEGLTNSVFQSTNGVLVEILGTGRSTTLPPSMHPKTERRYEWVTRRTLLDTAPSELPSLRPEDVLAIRKALTPWLKLPSPVRSTARAPMAISLDDAQRRRQEKYGLKILDDECRELAGMVKGSGRNRKVYDVACRVGRWVHNGILEATDVIDAIVCACLANGLVAEDGRSSVIKSARSGLSKSANDQLPLLPPSRMGGTRHA